MRARLILAGPVLLALAGCGAGGLCSNRITERSASADDLLEVEVYERDCGATTAYATHVDLVGPGEVPEGPSDLFVATRGNWHREWDDAEATARWTGPDRLLIIHDTASEVMERDLSFGAVAITYQAADTTG